MGGCECKGVALQSEEEAGSKLGLASTTGEEADCYEPAPDVAVAEAPAAELHAREPPSAADPVGEPAVVPAPPKLTVAIVGARGVRHADWMPGSGKADCFCTLKFPGHEKELYRSKVISNALEPCWQEEADVAEYSTGEPLEFGVWVADAGGPKEFVGKITLPSSSFDPDGFNGELKLELTGRDIQAYLKVKVKMAGREYPAGPPAEFSVKVERDPRRKKSVGLDLDTSDGTYAYVTGVKAGPFQTYNMSVKPAEQLRPGDFIVRVNSVEGSAKQLADEVQKAAAWELLVRRPVEVRAAVDKGEATKPLGLEFPRRPAGSALLISRVADGPFREWNSANPGQEVFSGDRIVAVGTHRGKAADLQKKMAAAASFQVTLVRPACPVPSR